LVGDFEYLTVAHASTAAVQFKGSYAHKNRRNPPSRAGFSGSIAVFNLEVRITTV